MDAIKSAMSSAASGMHAQSVRLRVITENIANAESTGSTPGADPYRRKTVTFGELVDRETGAGLVEVKRIGRDPSDFKLEYDPNHPAANDAGYVKKPNVSSLIEMGDLREAQRSYDASLKAFETSRNMLGATLDLLKR